MSATGQGGFKLPAIVISFIPSFWILIVIGVPFVILGCWGGFGQSFKTGAASAFICGAIAAAFGEALIEWGKDKLPSILRPTIPQSIFGEIESPDTEAPSQARGLRAEIDPLSIATVLLTFVLAIGIFAWNLYFAVADKRLLHPALDALQIVAFIVAAFYASNVRWVLSTPWRS